jgi:TonB-linked SusC/RagA family outer membrane protein
MRLSLIFLLTLINYNLFAQKNINGKVSDENNEGLPGATIIIKGTTKGTVSDINGIFMLDVNENDTITISFSGYIKQNIPVIGNISFSINLDPDVETLKEVVVVGYGSEQKINLTGSVATLKDQELTLAPVANSSNLLAGRVPGVMTRQNSGLPGGENTQIRIRSFSEAPLILVDGVQMDFSRIDQNDIASISVLKDASAAVYGARAGNGVVLVTTKRGESGKPKISYSSNLTLQSATAFLDHVSASQYVELVREANLNDFNDPNATFSEDDIKNYHSKTQGYEGGDWVDALIKNNAPMHQHNISVSGGNDNVKYFTSFGYIDQESFFKSRDFDYKRYNTRSNIDIKVNERINFSVDLSYRQDIRERPAKTALSNIWIDLSTAQPIFPTRLSENMVIPDPSVSSVSYSGSTTGNRNPLARSDRNVFGTYDRFDNTFRGKIGFKYKVPGITGLTLRADMNLTLLDRSEKTFRKPYNVYRQNFDTNELILEGVGNGVSSISDAQFRRTMVYPLVSAEYIKEVGNHNLKVLMLAEQTTRKFSMFSATRKNLFTTSIPELFIGSENEQTNDGSSGPDIGRKSAVARINYRFKDRYLLETTFRADGNVLFAPETRWGYFPSISFGWIISEEPFFNANQSTTLKIRSSFSQLGDDTANGISGFDYLTGYETNSTFLFGDNISETTIRTLGEVNPFLTWEKMTMYNLGLEATFFKGQLQLETDIFYRKRENILSNDQQSVANEGGYDLPLTNINISDDRGIEVSAVYQQKIGDFKIDIAPNFAIGKEKFVVRRDIEDFTDLDYKRIYGREGEWVNRRFGYLSDGIFMSQDEINNHPTIQDGNGNLLLNPGDIKYKDLDGNDTINFRDQDVIGYASNMPEINYGINLSASYKNLKLSLLLQGASKFSIYINGPAATMFSNGSIPLSYHYKYAWQPHPDDPSININPDAILPASSFTASTNNSRVSDFWLRDVRYLRLKNINLSYNIPKKIISKIGLDNSQIYFSTENLFTLTNLGIYRNSFDPEFDPNTQTTRRYPITRSFTVGLKMIF